MVFPETADVPALAEALSSSPGVEYAHPDYMGRGGGSPVPGSDTFYGDQWPLENTAQSGGSVDADMDVDEAWAIATGRRETLVGVLDSGVDSLQPERPGPQHTFAGWSLRTSASARTETAPTFTCFRQLRDR